MLFRNFFTDRALTNKLFRSDKNGQKIVVGIDCDTMVCVVSDTFVIADPVL